MNFKMIRYTLGLILLFESAFFLLPMIVAVCCGEWWELFSFFVTSLATSGLGLLMAFKKPEDRHLYARDGLAIVALSWITLSLFGAVPFVISGAIPNYLDALFETVSGFTTTGSTIIPNVEILPQAVLIWRSFTHWVGGMGVLVFIMAIMPISGAHNMHIMRAESPGPEVSKLVPRVRKTAIILYVIYFALTVLQLVLLLFGDMNFLEALNTALATAGTGGFGIKADSLGGYSVYTQIVVTVFMLLFSINFNSYYLVLRARFKDAFNSEVRAFLAIVIVAIAAISLNVYFSGDSYAAVRESQGINSFGDALRHAAFTVSSIISTSGFMTVDFDLWPTFSKTIIVILIFIGACAGSTGGGFKVSRIILLFKGMAREIGRIINPRQVKKITIDKKPVDHEVVRAVNAYLVCYVLIFVGSFILLTVDGYDPVISDGRAANEMVSNFTAVATALNNVGPGLEMIGPTQSFAFFSPFSKVVLIFDMLAGRLELFPILLLFSPKTWKR